MQSRLELSSRLIEMDNRGLEGVCSRVGAVEFWKWRWMEMARPVNVPHLVVTNWVKGFRAKPPCCGLLRYPELQRHFYLNKKVLLLIPTSESPVAGMSQCQLGSPYVFTIAGI